jgi:structural maintenance of chromosome 1
MDVDEDEDATQRPKQVQGYGIEVDFEGLDEDIRENGSVEDFDKEIAKLNSDIERMAPNLKAIERWVSFRVALGAPYTACVLFFHLGWTM